MSSLSLKPSVSRLLLALVLPSPKCLKDPRAMPASVGSAGLPASTVWLLPVCALPWAELGALGGEGDCFCFLGGFSWSPPPCVCIYSLQREPFCQ